jgi:hypothetical protein
MVLLYRQAITQFSDVHFFLPGAGTRVLYSYIILQIANSVNSVLT